VPRYPSEGSFGPKADIVDFEVAGLPTWSKDAETGAPITDKSCLSRNNELNQHRQAIVIVECRTIIAVDAQGEQSCVIVVEQRLLKPLPALWIPMQRHHVGEIGRSQTRPPG
jgi:hypothetical protein